MREIKVKIYWKLDNKVEYVGLFDLVEDREGVYEGRIGPSIPVVLYTGLKDKNGKEIYEGDIVRDGEYMAEEVTFRIACLMGIASTQIKNSSNKTIEVIGNIYENSDLLEE